MQTRIFFGILKAVCLSVDWVAKLIQKFFPTMEQKLVERCETEVIADSCNASYQVYDGKRCNDIPSLPRDKTRRGRPR